MVRQEATNTIMIVVDGILSQDRLNSQSLAEYWNNGMVNLRSSFGVEIVIRGLLVLGEFLGVCTVQPLWDYCMTSKYVFVAAWT